MLIYVCYAGVLTILLVSKLFLSGPFESNAEKSLINKRIISQLITLKPLYQHAECAILICWECLSIT